MAAIESFHDARAFSDSHRSLAVLRRKSLPRETYSTGPTACAQSRTDHSRTFADPKDDKIAKGTAYAGEHGQFLFVVAADQQPYLQIDQMPPQAATRVGNLWVYLGPLKEGTSYKFVWIVGGKPFGGANDVAAFTEESYPQPGVPQGKLTGPITIESKLYPGLKARMWYYVPAQWDGHTPLPVTWWADGQFYTATRPDAYRMLDAFDNLFAEKRIPLMANIFVEPGTAPERNIRSIEYDTVSDKYGHYLLEEVSRKSKNISRCGTTPIAARWRARVPAASAPSTPRT